MSTRPAPLHATKLIYLATSSPTPATQRTSPPSVPTGPTCASSRTTRAARSTRSSAPTRPTAGGSSFASRTTAASGSTRCTPTAATSSRSSASRASRPASSTGARGSRTATKTTTADQSPRQSGNHQQAGDDRPPPPSTNAPAASRVAPIFLKLARTRTRTARHVLAIPAHLRVAWPSPRPFESPHVAHIHDNRTQIADGSISVCDPNRLIVPTRQGARSRRSGTGRG